MVTFTINIPQMLAYIPYMDPMGYIVFFFVFSTVTLSQIGIETADSEICIVGGPHEDWGAGLGPRP